MTVQRWVVHSAATACACVLITTANGEATAAARGRSDPPAAHLKSTQAGGRWKVRAILTAGEVPGGETVDVDSSGRMADDNSVLKFQCTVDLSATERQDIDAAIGRARPAGWRDTYFPPGNPDGDDELQMVLELDRVDGEGRTATHRTRWLIATHQEAPADAVAVWNAIWQARRFCLLKK